MENFIKKEEIVSILNNPINKDPKFVRETLDYARSVQNNGLSLQQIACLLQNTDPEVEKEIVEIAREIKSRVYGNRVVLFAPLYVSNHCDNICDYCSFRHDNPSEIRKFLTNEEIKAEVAKITELGHKRLLMVYGEADYSMKTMMSNIEAAYSVRTGNGANIRRINMNIAPLDVADFKELKKANIGTFQCFQETYDWDTYHKVHLKGKKADYMYRLYAMHRSIEAGIDDVGMGVLLGLHDYKEDMMSLFVHAKQLEKDFNGVGPHTISFPRINPAVGAELSYNPPSPVSDDQLKRIVAITRMAVPYTGMIMSTRENANFRNWSLGAGVSQISAGSHTTVGGYCRKEDEEHTSQFSLNDDRSLDEVVYDLAKNGFIPSFCTGCYRRKRTGEVIMGQLKSEEGIKMTCMPNAISTFSEYLRDYASDKTKEVGKELVENMVKKAPEHLKPYLQDTINKISDGENDILI